MSGWSTGKASTGKMFKQTTVMKDLETRFTFRRVTR